MPIAVSRKVQQFPGISTHQMMAELAETCSAVTNFKKDLIFFLICIVGGGIKVHSTLRPLNGLLFQPRVIMIMEKSVEWLARETEVLGENLPQCRFVHHKPHTRTRAAAVGSQCLTAELRHGQDLILVLDIGTYFYLRG
jgi:hypothetical protein